MATKSADLFSYLSTAGVLVENGGLHVAQTSPAGISLHRWAIHVFAAGIVRDPSHAGKACQLVSDFIDHVTPREVVSSPSDLEIEIPVPDVDAPWGSRRDRCVLVRDGRPQFQNAEFPKYLSETLRGLFGVGFPWRRISLLVAISTPDVVRRRFLEIDPRIWRAKDSADTFDRRLTKILDPLFRPADLVEPILDQGARSIVRSYRAQRHLHQGDGVKDVDVLSIYDWLLVPDDRVSERRMKAAADFPWAVPILMSDQNREAVDRGEAPANLLMSALGLGGDPVVLDWFQERTVIVDEMLLDRTLDDQDRRLWRRKHSASPVTNICRALTVAGDAVFFETPGQAAALMVLGSLFHHASSAPGQRWPQIAAAIVRDPEGLLAELDGIGIGGIDGLTDMLVDKRDAIPSSVEGRKMDVIEILLGETGDLEALGDFSRRYRRGRARMQDASFYVDGYGTRLWRQRDSEEIVIWHPDVDVEFFPTFLAALDGGLDADAFLATFPAEDRERTKTRDVVAFRVTDADGTAAFLVELITGKVLVRSEGAVLTPLRREVCDLVSRDEGPDPVLQRPASHYCDERIPARHRLRAARGVLGEMAYERMVALL